MNDSSRDSRGWIGCEATSAQRRVASRATLTCLGLLIAACNSPEHQPDSTPAAVAPPIGSARAALVSTLTLNATGDTFVRSLTPNQNMGGDTRLSLQVLGRHRSLLFFDPNAIRAQVGSGTLVSARLELSIASNANNWGPGRSIAVHRLAQASAEYEATWSCARDSNTSNLQPDCSGANVWLMNATSPAQQPWQSPATATTLISNGQGGTIGFDVTTDVAAILSGSYAGHGWLLKKVEETQTGSIEFSTREVGAGPKLVLQVDGAPGGGGTGPVVGSATVLPSRDGNIRQLLPNQNFGTENTLRIQALGKHRALLGFDPAAVVDALDGPLVRARLRLPIADTSAGWGPDRALGAHRLRQTWTELGATWNCATDTNTGNIFADCSGASAWEMQGPSLQAAWVNPPTATVLVSNQQTGTLELDVTRDVACALAGHAPLHGWLVKKEMENQGGRIDLRSREASSGPGLFLEWTDGNGVVVSAQDCGVSGPPGGCTPSAAQDTTCNGVDDDCDGSVDDDFEVTSSTCGVGACAASGEVSCVAGEVVDDCAPGLPATNDMTCDAIDDDCDEVVDDDYPALSTSCGVGACNRSGATSCVLGQVIDSCQPGAPSASDPSCNAVDDDCDGAQDEDYVAVSTSCGVGACTAGGSTSCFGGEEVDGCAPGAPANADATCDGIDDDCDAVADEDFVPTCAGSSRQTCEGGTLHGTACSDGNACNGQETCQGAGECQPGVPPVLDDGNSCTADSCSAASGVVHTPLPNGTSCADQDVCNGSETCDGAGSCQPGTPLALDDGNPCTSDACDATLGVRHDPVLAGIACADADLCNGAETCDASGNCQPGTPPSVSDGNPCTADTCDPLGGVSHTPVAAGSNCSDGNVCNGSETCNGAGSCAAGTPVAVDDGNPCTTDACDATAGVTHAPVAAGFSCADADVCNGSETCNASGACQPGQPLDFDDQNPCTVDGCHPVLGVQNTPAAAGTSCSDGLLCNGEEQCDENATCDSGVPTVIDDGDPCTFDQCSESQGVTHQLVAAGTACGDGDVCNGTETCDSSGSCMPGTPLEVEQQGGPCVIQTTCDPGSGLVVEYQPTGTPCATGFVCDGAGACLRDQGGGTPVPPIEPGTAAGITVYGPSLPREPSAGCALEPISPDHVAVISGRVYTWSAQLEQRVPVAGAIVSIPARCELGEVSTLIDGTFRLPVNGGEPYMIRVDADADGDGDFDYLPAEREVQPEWRATAGAAEIELVLPAAPAEAIPLIAGTVADDIIVSGPMTSDDRDGDGVAAPRTPSVLLKAGTTLTGVDADGEPVELGEAVIRMTEYTVGQSGLTRMPAPMPPETAYGYAVELSVDGAEHVYFNQPAVFYVDNFIGAESRRSGVLDGPQRVGLPVPAWSYDREQQAWAQEDDGIIIRLLGVDGSSPPRARIDADGDGDGDAADDSYLAARNFVIDDVEREQLALEIAAGRRAVNDELMRVELQHFSPFDWNWILRCGESCKVGDVLDKANPDSLFGEDDCKPGSRVNVESMSLSESFAVAGTPFSLNYNSSTVYGYKPRRQQRVDRSLPPVPSPISISGISERLSVAGKFMNPEGCQLTSGGLVCHEYEGYDVSPGLITWDGLDADGRLAYGTHKGHWSVTTSLRAAAGNSLFVRDLLRVLPVRMTVYDAKLLGLGGWTISPQHFFDAEGGILFGGDGRESRSGAAFIEKVRDLSFNPTNTIAVSMTVNRDGSIFFANGSGLFRINPQGQQETWRTGSLVATADGPDRAFVGNRNVQTPSTIRRLDLINGVVQETATINTSARLAALAVGPDRLLYAIVNSNPITLHRFTLDLVHADGGAAYKTLPGNSSAASSSAMSFDGSTLYMAIGNAGGIFRLGPSDTSPVRIANSGALVGTGLADGQPALSFQQNNNTDYRGVLATPEGVMFARSNDQRLWLIDHAGILRLVAGDPQATPGSGDGGAAIFAGLGSDFAFDVAPDASIYIYQRSPTASIRRVRPPGPGGFASPQTTVPSEDGRLSHDFDLDGRHLRTRNVHTGDVLYSFEYEDGLLSAIVEGNNQGPGAASLPRTRLLRSEALVTIEAPSGQRTEIALNPDTGYASSLTDATGATVALTHDSGGLLRELRDQRGFVHAYDYDEHGQLISDTSPGLQPQTLAGSHLLSVAHVSGDSEESDYGVTLNESTKAVTRTHERPDSSFVNTSIDLRRQRRTQTSSDGTVIDEAFRAHPLFGTASPVLSTRSTRLPSGTTRQETHSLTLAAPVWTETFGLNGNNATMRTNQSLRTITTTSAQGRTTVTTVDAQGRPTRMQVGNLEPSNFTYDPEGRLVLVTRGSGASERATSLDYYADGTGLPEAGHLMSITDALNHSVDFTRDAFGRALTVTTSAETTRLGYSATGSLEQLITANDNTHVQLYNGVDLLTDYYAPALPGTDDATQFTYDNTRRLTTTTLPGVIGITLTRDAADPAHPERKGRLRSISSPNSGNGTSPFQIAHKYSDECTGPCPPGTRPAQLASLARGDLTSSFVWDGIVPVRETLAVQPGSLTGLTNVELATILNANFQAQSDRVTTGAGTLQATYAYDNDTALTCAGSGTNCGSVNGVLYRFDGGAGDSQNSGHGLLEGTSSGVISEAFGYNAFGELATQVVNVNGSPLITTTYDAPSARRDALGRITARSVTRDGVTTTVRYGYDTKGQLLTISADGEPTRTNKYDANGNRLCTYESPATDCDDEAWYDAQDRLLAYGDVEYLYTDRGSLFQRDDGATLQTFTYDALGNLTRVEEEGGSTIDYVIDAQGRRVGKQHDGSLVRQYVWSSALRIAAELSPSGAVVSHFIYGNKTNVPDLIARPGPSGTVLYRVITDHLGSPIYVVNIANPSDVLLDASYDEWGKVETFTSSTGAWPIPFGFAGGLYDEDTGLVRFGARDYDPEIGRWTNKDPIRWDGGQANLYVYVGNNPVVWLDVAGLWGGSFGFSAGLGLGYPLGFGGDVGVGIAFDWEPGESLTFAVYKQAGAQAGAGFFASFGLDVNVFRSIEDFAGVSPEAKLDLGLVYDGKVHSALPTSGKGGFGVLGVGAGFGVGLWAGAGISATSLDGVRVDTDCWTADLYDRL